MAFPAGVRATSPPSPSVLASLGAGGRPLIMAVLNVTPDSFSDGSAHIHPVATGLRMIADGADIVDVGGESSRPGAQPVPIGEEMRRILPVVAALAREGACVSVDTRNALTMRSALLDGARIVNDVSALAHDPESGKVVAQFGCPVVLMHMRGTPQTMAGLTFYADIVADVAAELSARIAHAEAAGIARCNIVIDPGFGFAKTSSQSLELLRHLGALRSLGVPILVGISRKGFIGQSSGGGGPAHRLGGSLAAALYAAQHGASILRVHDVAETVQALRMWSSLCSCDKERDISGADPGR